MELAFEYLINRDKMQWVTIYSDQVYIQFLLCSEYFPFQNTELWSGLSHTNSLFVSPVSQGVGEGQGVCVCVGRGGGGGGETTSLDAGYLNT